MMRKLDKNDLKVVDKKELVGDMNYHYFNMIDVDFFNIEQLDEYVSTGNRDNISRFVSTMVVIEHLIAEYRMLPLVEQDEDEITFYVDQVIKKNEILKKINQDKALLKFIDDEIYEMLYV
ncbi:hypothetical protein [Macrococcus armenti]|uniref:hypothetical protein n=1 Tax=Macrococcus armenti TaxID=2875764 RepID=UPI001CC92C0D|nr:hypothetical protein [Macrococcus armenti]UBH15800.1 hypothetical protein LAU44_02295 [Macrococcus armenti]UBH18159.1 hypothetical protein LAU39_02300 [Macrococcus armenti]UBH20426.1 hypothetical protein LAU40_02295 [Macrococcus armenti]